MTPPAWCPDCGAPHQLVRPGKTQATCECWTRCHLHGLGAIQYHAEGEFKNISGYFCAMCQPPPDHEDFLAVRALGFAAMRRHLNKRRKKSP